ncbi:hypothetical protein SIN8267_01245 [Sinobacterium norvegicum]|uniref:Uncharacterized protein n=1 Tax=Sinobacterium norvegicum TaxID=1641715 RepID=A0ABN8EFG3_9GAMM|nr:hypothetical protein [Sinobacterium norvegicum]CAH0991143.1 hypothetical protein SIN8267_01245 [Sinobacterium norvegicum]
MDIEYKKASQKYSVSYMNNSKWFKLFSAWADSGIEVDHSIWRFLDSDHQEIHRLPIKRDLLHNRFNDGRFQPFEYKWIFSVFIPRRYKPVSNVGYEREQDIDSLKSIADTLGKYPVFETEEGLEVRGYEV